MKRRTATIFLSFVFISTIIAFLIGGFYLKKDSNFAQRVRETSEDIAANIIPDEYEKMTIPYLRSKSYNSKLSELNLYANESGYTSYLTSYNSDGLRINGLLTKPSGETTPQEGWPAIVFVHGYIPPSLYQTTGTEYSDYVDFLARNGFVVFKIDLRGHGESEGSAGGGYFGSDYVVDTLNAYSALQNSGFVNPSKIGLWGHSMAGNAVMRSFAVRPEISGVVIWAGAVYSYTDLLKYGLSDNSYRPPVDAARRGSTRQQLYEKVGSPSAQSPFWKQVTPLNYLSDLKGGIQIHHAVDDNVVNIGYSRDLKAELDKTNIPHEFFEYSSGGHNISGASFNLAMQRTIEFFKNPLN